MRMSSGRLDFRRSSLVIDGLVDRQNIGLRLWDDTQTDARYAVRASHPPVALGFDPDVRDVAQSYDVVVCRASTRAEKSSVVCSPVSVRRLNSRDGDSMRPAGSSTFSRRSVSSTS